MRANLDFIRIQCVSPAKVLDWSERILPNGKIIGEISTSETVNYKTLKPIEGGLFCQQIFGTIQDKKCNCQKKKNYRSPRASLENDVPAPSGSRDKFQTVRNGVEQRYGFPDTRSRLVSASETSRYGVSNSVGLINNIEDYKLDILYASRILDNKFFYTASSDNKTTILNLDLVSDKKLGSSNSQKKKNIFYNFQKKLLLNLNEVSLREATIHRGKSDSVFADVSDPYVKDKSTYIEQLSKLNSNNSLNSDSFSIYKKKFSYSLFTHLSESKIEQSYLSEAQNVKFKIFSAQLNSHLWKKKKKNKKLIDYTRMCQLKAVLFFKKKWPQQNKLKYKKYLKKSLYLIRCNEVVTSKAYKKSIQINRKIHSSLRFNNSVQFLFSLQKNFISTDQSPYISRDFFYIIKKKNNRSIYKSVFLSKHKIQLITNSSLRLDKFVIQFFYFFKSKKKFKLTNDYISSSSISASFFPFFCQYLKHGKRKPLCQKISDFHSSLRLNNSVQSSLRVARQVSDKRNLEQNYTEIGVPEYKNDKESKSSFFESFCFQCGIFQKSSRRRRYQLGYIDLLLYFSHIWYLKSRPCILSIILDLPQNVLHQIIYMQRCLISQSNYCMVRGDIWKAFTLKRVYVFLFGQLGFDDKPAPWNKKNITFESSLNDFGALSLFRFLKSISLKNEIILLKNFLYNHNKKHGSSEKQSFSLIQPIGHSYLPAPLSENIFFEWLKKNDPFFSFGSGLELLSIERRSEVLERSKREQVRSSRAKGEGIDRDSSQLKELDKFPFLLLQNFVKKKRFLNYPFEADFFFLNKNRNYKLTDNLISKLRSIADPIQVQLRSSSLHSERKVSSSKNFVSSDWSLSYHKSHTFRDIQVRNTSKDFKRFKKQEEIFYEDKMTKIFWPICFEKSFNFLIGVDQSYTVGRDKSETVKRLVSSYSMGFYTSRVSRDKCFWKIANLWFFFHYSLNCFFEKKQQNLDSKIFFSKELFLFRLKWARFQLFSNRRLLPPNLKSQKGFLLQKNWVEHEYRLFRRLKILQRFEIGRNTENILLKFLPVLPPTLRPLMQMSDGFLVSSDLNDLYLHVLRRKNRFLRILMKSNSVPLRVLIGDYGLVQQSIDVLLENGRVGKMEKKSYPTSRALKSLTDFIQGKQGRFRHNLLGKRVDYSARSVIIVGPKLRISQCGLPREIALKLFYPFILKFLLRIKKVKSVFAAKIFIEKHSKLVPKKKFYFPGLGTKNDQSLLASFENYAPAPSRFARELRTSVRRDRSHTVSNGVETCTKFSSEERGLYEHSELEQAKQRMFERKKEIADSMQFWNFIQKVIGNHPILLNRAPTLHRLGIQAFFPVLVPGRAIQLHPLVCPTFNADFDGDQMGVHLPLSIQAQCESRLLMLSSHNWLSPATGQPNLLPSQDMVLGFYYLTTPVHNSIPYIFFQKKIHFIHAFEQNQIGLHTSVWLKWEAEYENTNKQEFLQEIIIHSSGQTRYLFDFSFYFEDTYAQKLKKYIRTTAGRVYFNQLF